MRSAKQRALRRDRHKPVFVPSGAGFARKRIASVRRETGVSARSFRDSQGLAASYRRFGAVKIWRTTRCGGFRRYSALPGSPAHGRVDLLTAVLHELGHVVDYDHDTKGLMDDTLPLGMRRLPGESLDYWLSGNPLDEFGSLGIEQIAVDSDAVDAVFGRLE